MGYFVKASEDREAYDLQIYDRMSFRNYLRGKGIDIRISHAHHAHELEEEYKDEFATWLALRRMGVK